MHTASATARIPARRLALLVLATLLTFLVLAAQARAEDSVPTAARTIAAELDAQLADRLGMMEGPAKGTSLIVSTPVSLENMEQSCPLARLLGEELAFWFVKNGYRVREVRKTKNLMLDPGTGEVGLSRDLRFVDSRYVQSAVLLTATYTQTSRHVRFNVRLLHAPTGEVLAMASETLRISHETSELLDDKARKDARRIRPSVATDLRDMRRVAATDQENPRWSAWQVPGLTELHNLSRPVRPDEPNVIDLTN